MVSLEDVKGATARFLASKWQTEVTVTQCQKIFGGASRETYRLSIEKAGVPENIILRRDPPTSLIDTERELEYQSYAKIFPTEIPVPEPLFLENDTSWLERPFSIMRAIDNAQTDVSLLDPTQKKALGEQKWTILGCLASKDPCALGFDQFMSVPPGDDFATSQLDYWEGVIISDEIHPQPVARAAIRWLRANMPAPAQKLCVVHGDYRTGNFLYHPDQGILGILDWEMCHLGDPLEDLAWSLDPLWHWNEPELSGRLLPMGQAISYWEKASGLHVDPEVFLWWRIFVSVKALAIWISSSEDYHHGKGKDSILAMAGWVMTDRQTRILIDYLHPTATGKGASR